MKIYTLWADDTYISGYDTYKEASDEGWRLFDIEQQENKMTSDFTVSMFINNEFIWTKEL